MNIVVLDGYTLNPGDLSWDGIRNFGHVTLHDRTGHSADQIIKTIGDAEIVLTNKTPLTGEILKQVPSVKYIGVLATGYNVVDTAAAKESGIVVTNVPAYSTGSVAQLTFALLLEICHHVGSHSQAVFKGDWSRSVDFSFWNYPLLELSGKTMGIIGFGRIGQTVAKIAQTFGLKVLVNDSNKIPSLENENCKYVTTEVIFAESDIISLHCPLTESNRDLINRNSISKMKDGVILINTARGPLINEADLSDALNSGKVGGAAVDVVSVEPIKADNPLLKAKNCIITPHIAWAPKEARVRLMDIAVDNLRAFLAGEPVNVVS